MDAQRKRVGLAFGSGGARGLAHIGVIKTLLANDIPIDIVAGASAGALIGGLYAASQSYEQLLTLSSTFGYREFMSVFFAPTFSSGLVRNDNAKKFLESYLHGIDIEHLPIPFSAVTTDILTGETVILQQGNLASAIVASSSIPLFFEPSNYHGRYLVDGGVSLPVPAKLVYDMGADIVIAVNLEHFEGIPQTQPSMPTAAQISAATIDILKHRLAEVSAEDADVVIEPKFQFSSLDMFKFLHGENIIKVGEEETLKFIPMIKELLKRESCD